MTAYLAPQFDTQFFDGSNVAAGYKLYTYDSGTTTPKAVYSDQAGTVPHTNPIVLDANGRVAGQMFLGSGEYTFTLKTSDDVLVKAWNDVAGSGTANEAAAYDSAIRADLASTSGAGMVGFLQSGAGAVSRTLQDKATEVVSVKDFGAVGDGTADDSAAIVAAVAAIPGGRGTLRFPSGTYKWTGVITLPARVNVTGDGGDATVLSPTGDGFQVVQGTTDVGLTVYRDFTIQGTSRTANTAFAMGFSTSIANQLKGVRFLNVNIDKFQFGIHARTLWHSNIHGVRITNCQFGVAYRGQCVSASITATQILSLGSVFGDGSIGVHAIGYIYDDTVLRKPEAVLIDAETLIYGYDTNVWLQECFIGSVVNSDIDAGLQYAIRVTDSDGNCTIKDNYICHLANVGAASYGVKIDDIGSANDSPINIEGNKVLGIGTMFSGSTSISIGYLHSGKKFVAKNKASGAKIALSLQDPTSATVTDNVLDGGQFSLNTQNGGGNYYARNVFNGPIRREGTRTRDTFDNNSGTAVTCYHGPILVPDGATTVTTSLVTDLALPANPVTAAPASLVMKVSAHQWEGATSRGDVRSYYDGSGNLVTTVGTAFGGAVSDIWVDMESL